MVEPILLSIATTLATKAAGTLSDLVRSAFDRHPKAAEALAAAEAGGEGSPEVGALAESLASVAAAEPEFDRQLRAEWSRVTTNQRADHGGVNNQITGNVLGKVVQARDITGNINL